MHFGSNKPKKRFATKDESTDNCTADGGQYDGNETLATGVLNEAEIAAATSTRTPLLGSSRLIPNAPSLAVPK